MSDGAAELWTHARAISETEDERLLERVADCVALTLIEAANSVHDARRRAIASALAAGGDGSARVVGVGKTSPQHAVVANGFLVHADLRDDAYRVAAHPGLPVVPTAVAVAEAADASGEQLLRAALGGYEVACVLADLLLPQLAERGWRVTAALASAAAAVTAALASSADDDVAVEALRLAFGAAGGPLAVVASASEGWQLQPALLAGAGISAFSAASAGLRGPIGILESEQGPLALLSGKAWSGLPQAGRPRILDVTFKRYPVAMYGQAIFDAVARSRPLSGQATALAVGVSPFAAAYGLQGGAPTPSVASVAGIALRALTECQQKLTPPPVGAILVVGDEKLPPLAAWLEISINGDTVLWTGSGDTSTWTVADVERHACARAGGGASALLAASRALRWGGDVDAFVRAWLALA